MYRYYVTPDPGGAGSSADSRSLRSESVDDRTFSILGPCVGVLSVGFSVVGLFTMAVLLPTALQRIQRTHEFVDQQAAHFRVRTNRLWADMQQVHKQLRQRRQLHSNDFSGPALSSFPLPLGFIPFPFHKFRISRRPVTAGRFVGDEVPDWTNGTENTSLPDEALVPQLPPHGPPAPPPPLEPPVDLTPGEEFTFPPPAPTFAPNRIKINIQTLQPPYPGRHPAPYVTASCVGPPGLPGPDGRNGLDGMPAPDGAPGADATPTIPEENSYECRECPSGPPGPMGDVGDEGPPGPQGRRGESGTDGLPGPPSTCQGTPGAVGSPGERGFPGEDGLPGSDWISGVGAPGLPGPAGAIGARGAQGIPGRLRIVVGPPGMVGPPGRDGVSGMLGVPGTEGEVGSPGPDRGYCPCPKRQNTSYQQPSNQYSKSSSFGSVRRT